MQAIMKANKAIVKTNLRIFYRYFIRWFQKKKKTPNPKWDKRLRFKVKGLFLVSELSDIGTAFDVKLKQDVNRWLNFWPIGC